MKSVKPRPMPTIVAGVREIEGVKFHITGSELIETLNKRAKEHLVKAKEAQASLKTADEALQVAQNAAAKAGKAGNSTRLPKSSHHMATVGSSRNYGGDIEDPVEALREAVIHHNSRAALLKFYASHLISSVTYVIGHHDVDNYELLNLEEEY